MTKQNFEKSFLLLTKIILTTLTAAVLLIFCRTLQMTQSMDPSFYLTVPEQTAHILAGLMLYVIFACAGSYAVNLYDT
ncbi:MAG: hypothetical protein E7658_02795 [Ruminococcaceae bacterium]|nr:hypothetical protein [Oscillospiraceae bacterium]